MLLTSVVSSFTQGYYCRAGRSSLPFHVKCDARASADSTRARQSSQRRFVAAPNDTLRTYAAGNRCPYRGDRSPMTAFTRHPSRALKTPANGTRKNPSSLVGADAWRRAELQNAPRITASLTGEKRARCSPSTKGDISHSPLHGLCRCALTPQLAYGWLASINSVVIGSAVITNRQKTVGAISCDSGRPHLE